MALTFEDLCQQLKLSKEYSSDSQLNILEAWIREHSSTDCRFYGSPEERYSSSMDFVQEYLDNFLPGIPADSTEIVARFNNMNTIQYAAYLGYDRFLSQTHDNFDSAVDIQNKAGMTPLHLAAWRGHLHTVERLLALGASVTLANKQGHFPLQSSLSLPMYYEEPLVDVKIGIFRLLRERAPYLINSIDSNNETILDLMAVNGFATLIHELVQEKNPNLFHYNNYGKYPVHEAILAYQLQCTREFLFFEGMADVTDAEKRTALHYAAKYTDAEFVEACCEHFANINARDKYNMTPLLIAAESGNLSSLQALISRGADPLLTDYKGYTLLHCAVLSKNRELISWVLDNLETVIDLNAGDLDGHSALYYLERSSEFNTESHQIAETLKSKGAISSLGNNFVK